MAYNSNAGRQSFTASSGQTDFSFNFKIFEGTDLEIYKTPSGQVANDTTDLLTIDIDYTVTVDGDNGGTIMLLSGATLNDTIVALRVLQSTRTVSYVTNGDLLAATLNADQNYQTYLLADKETQQSRSLHLPKSVVGVDTEIETPIPNAYQRWDASGTKLENDTTIPDAVVQSAANAAAALLSEQNAAVSEDNAAISASAIGNMVNIDTIADLRLMTTTPANVYVTGYHTANDGAFGSNFFKLVPNIYIDNGMTIFVTAVGTYKLQFSGFLNLKFAGAKGDGATDDSEAILIAYKVLVGNEYSTLFVPSGTYMTKEFGSASSQPGWAGLAGLGGKTILGDGSTSIFKLIGGENTALFNQAMFTSKIESIRFDGNNPPPAWTGDQTGLYTLNPLTENLVMIDGFGYDLPNCVAQFSGGNGFYLKGNNGVIDIRGANSKSWYNWGWGYYITECFTLRGNSPWVEQNIVGGIHIDAGTVVANRLQYLDSNITFKNIYYERVSVYPTGHATNTSTGVEIEGICGVQIDGLNSLLAPNDTHIHIKENPLSNVGVRGSYGTKISISTNTLRIKIDDNCNNTTIVRNGIAGGIDNSRTLILEDNARNTKVVWDSLPNAIKLSENSNKATVYGIDSNLASASATKSNGTVVQGGVLGAIADYDSTFGSQAELSLNSLIASSNSSLYNNHVLPINAQLYTIIGLKAEASCQISLTLQDAVTNQYYNFDTEVFETITTSSTISYNLKTDTNNIWYSVPFMTDATAGRKLRIKISASSNDGKTPSLYHAFIADRREPQITSLRSSIQIRNGNVIKCTTALRPLPTLVKEGNSFFNTTTKLLNISDGTNWLNPAGVIV